MAVNDDVIDQIYKKVEKSYGEGVIIDGQSILDVPRKKISLGPTLDVLTYGGIEEGSWLGITGNPGFCKTSVALSFAANCQKDNRPIFYGQVEGRLPRAVLLGTKGLVLDKPHFNLIRSQPGAIMSAQKYLEVFLEIIKMVPNAVLVIDSISSLCEEREMADGVGTETRGGGAKLYSQFCRLASNIVPIHNTIVVGITHLIANTGSPMGGYIERAARMWGYQCDYQLRVMQRQNWESGKRHIGYTLSWVCNKGKNGPPGRKGDSYVRFGTGIDRLSEVIELGVSSGVIGQAQSWLTLSYLEKYDVSLAKTKVQGKEKLHALLDENPQWTQWLEQEISEMAS